MSTGGGQFLGRAGGALFFFTAAVAGADPNPLQNLKDLHTTDFTSEQYFEPPNQQQVKIRLSGAEAVPLPGGLLEVKRLKIEKFTADGRTEAVVEAPECVYAPLDNVASSAGRLTLRTGDGKFRVEGEGFLWRLNESSLTISNEVRTVIEMPATAKTGL